MSFFEPPKPAAVTPAAALPPPPDRSDAETSALADEQRRGQLRRVGRSAQLLTGAGGSSGGSFAVRLLGGAGSYV